MRRVWYVTSGLVVTAMLLLAPGANAGWLAPIAISEPAENAGAPNVVLDAAGDATAVWDEWDGNDTVVEASVRPAGGEWQTPTDLSEEGGEVLLAGEHDAGSPAVAVDAAGDTTVVWSRYAGANRILIQSIYRPVGGSWQAPVDLGEMHSAVDPEPQVSTNEAGDTTAVWKSDEVVESSYRPAGGSWEAPAALSAEESFVPQTAIDERGDATAVWMHYDGSHYVVEGAYRAASGAWGAPTLVSEPGEEAGDPRIALDGAGDTIATWKGHPAIGDVVRSAYRPAGGAWQEPLDVSTPGGEAQSLDVALDAHGDALLVWSGDTKELGAYEIAQSAYRPAGGTWQKPVALAEGGGNSYPSDVVFDTQGNAAVVWERSNGGGDVVQADYRPAGEGWQTPTNLSEEGQDSTDAVVVLDSPGVSTAADGDATVVWASGSGGGCRAKPKCKEAPTYRIEASGYDSAEPSETLEVPAVGEVGTPVSVSAPSLDVFSPLLNFGDGSEDAGTSAAHTYEAPGEYTVSFTSTELLGYRSTTKRRIVIDPEAPAKTPPGEPSSGSNEGETKAPQNDPTQQQQLGTTTHASGIASIGIAEPFKVSLRPFSATLAGMRRTREMRFTCRLSEPGRCVVHTALGSGRIELARAGSGTVTVRLTPRAFAAIRHLHLLRLAYTATATAAGQGPVTTAGRLVAR
jgi:PKD domain